MAAACKAILIADDCQEDTFLLKRAFLKAGISTPVHFVADGQEAVDYLCGEGAFEDRAEHPFPQLLVLDLKMPKMDGFDVLKWMQDHKKLKRLPVTILTSSAEQTDLNRAYDLGAN